MTLFPDSGYRPLPEGHIDYAELAQLEADLLNAVGGRDALEEKLRSFFRSAIDEVIDTARTGRFFLSDLDKNEKTYLGTKFEILLRDWLDVPKGVYLDLKIGGREVDIKSTTRGGSDWMIPLEAIDQFCILLRVNENLAICAFGIVRCRPSYLRTSENRDKKTSLSAKGVKNIWWLVSNFSYTPNFWTQISDDVRHAIMGIQGGGTKRLAALFENCLGMPISRVQVAAVAAQDDFMKRLRANGGARDILSSKGIFIFYSGKDRDLMRALGLSVGHREFISFAPQTEEEWNLIRTFGHTD